jgi:hypothetical protein
MTDLPEHDPPPESGEPEVLARLPHGESGGGLSVNPLGGADSHQKGALGDEQLQRPRGALVALRISGGIQFAWRLIVVHRDGRVIYKRSGVGGAEHAQVIGRLQPDQLDELQALIARSDFAPPSAAARQNPDALAYEIVARVGRRNRSTEAFEGSVSFALRPLIDWLRKLIPASPQP